MAVLTQFFTLLLPQSRIDAIAGLRAHLSATYPSAREDNELWGFGSMTPPHEVAAALQSAGVAAADMCIVDYNRGPTTPCGWLEYNVTTKQAKLVVHAPPSPLAAVSPVAPAPVIAPPPPAAPGPFAAAAAAAAAPISPAPFDAAQNPLVADILANASTPGAVPAQSGAANFSADDEKKWRIWRIAALVAVLLFRSTFFIGPDGFSFYPENILYVLYPSLGNLVIFALIGWQVYALKRPAHARPGVAVYLVEHHGSSTEVMSILGGWFVTLVILPTVTTNFAWYLFEGAVGLVELALQALLICGVLLIVVRQTIVIDGEKKNVTRFSWKPKVKAYSQIQGLGTLTIKVNGIVRSTFLAVFHGASMPWRLQATTPQRLPALALELIKYTGIPQRPTPGGS